MFGAMLTERRNSWTAGGAGSFTHDVFISYAHIDNQALSPGQEGWISALHRSLEVRLSQLRGGPVRVWRDPKLQGNDLFGDQIVDQLPRVGVLVLVLSPRYVQSEWCLRELRAFCQAAEGNGGLQRGDRSRLFKVVKTPVALERSPSEVHGLLGYEFYRADPFTGRVRELSQATDPDGERLYWTRLDDLAHDIAQLLDTLAAPPPPPPDTAPGSSEAAEPAESAQATDEQEPVYIAETSYDLQEQRDAIRRDLLLSGLPVLPQRPLPLVAPELVRAVQEDLARSRFAVHLLGKSYGVVPDGETRSVVELQVELAAARGLPRLIWLPPEPEDADPRIKSLRERLVTDETLQAGTDLLAVPLEELKAAIHERLRPARPEADEETSSLIRIYLVCDRADLDRVQPIADYLFDQGFEVILPAFEGDEAAVRLDHQENLTLCEAVILFYGVASELWLRVKLRELQKVAGYGRTRPIQASAIWVDAPTSEAKERLRTREALVLRGGDGEFRPALLAPFLARIGRQTP
jgi:hypothetical protein